MNFPFLKIGGTKGVIVCKVVDPRLYQFRCGRSFMRIISAKEERDRTHPLLTSTRAVVRDSLWHRFGFCLALAVGAVLSQSALAISLISPFQVSLDDGVPHASTTSLSLTYNYNQPLYGSIVEAASALAAGPTATSSVSGFSLGDISALNPLRNGLFSAGEVNYFFKVGNVNAFDLSQNPVQLNASAFGSTTTSGDGSALAYFYITLDNGILNPIVGDCAQVSNQFGERKTQGCFAPVANSGASFNFNQTVSLLTNVSYRVAMAAQSGLGHTVASQAYSGSASAFVDPLIALTPSELQAGYTLTVSNFVNQQSPVPEPTSGLLLGAGVALLITYRRALFPTV